MEVEYDPEKRELVLTKRGLDMAEAGQVFDGPHVTTEDDRFDYGETRYGTVGLLNGRMVFVVWTVRGPRRRIISMRKINEREQKRYGPLLGL